MYSQQITIAVNKYQINPLLCVILFSVLIELLWNITSESVHAVVMALNLHSTYLIRDLRHEFEFGFGILISAYIMRRLVDWPKVRQYFTQINRAWLLIAGLAGEMGFFYLLLGVFNHNLSRPFAIANYNYPFVFSTLIVLFASVVEEVAYRGYILTYLERHYGSFVAVFGSSFTFGASHLLNGGKYDVIGCLILASSGGLLCSVVFIWTRSLFLPIGLHWGYDVVCSLIIGGQHFHPLYATPNSQAILYIITLLECYVGLILLSIAYRKGRLRVSSKTDAFLQKMINPKAKTSTSG